MSTNRFSLYRFKCTEQGITNNYWLMIIGIVIAISIERKQIFRLQKMKGEKKDYQGANSHAIYTPLIFWKSLFKLCPWYSWYEETFYQENLFKTLYFYSLDNRIQYFMRFLLWRRNHYMHEYNSTACWSPAVMSEFNPQL